MHMIPESKVSRPIDGRQVSEKIIDAGTVGFARGSIAATNRTDKAIDERANMNASSANLKDFSCFTAQRFKTAHGLSLVWRLLR